MPLSLIPSPSLRWSLPSSPRPSYPLPPSITRSFISYAPHQKLEILIAASTYTSPSSHPPIIFIHGGFGGAFVWIEWMTFLQQHGVTCYAISLRGHGESWNPGFWRMTWGTGLAALAQDVCCVWNEVVKREGGRLPILVGHSSGGGLAQYVLSEGLVRAEALVLCGAIPGFGGLGVHWKWFKLDPWFLFREYLHLMHPRSPLSSTALVHQAFFSPGFPRSKVAQWQHWMPEWESLRWPLGMMRPFVSFPRILENITGLGKRVSHVCIMAGSEDKLVGVKIPQRLANVFRDAVKASTETKKTDGPADFATEENETHEYHADLSHGVHFVVVKGAGHHFQNDLQQETGARQLLAFIRRLS
ncbi:MAG: hypothetical protein Q9182_005552 [Xanthomendoza sp. 2 TL-2023]